MKHKWYRRKEKHTPLKLLNNNYRDIVIRCPDCGSKNTTSISNTFHQCDDCGYYWDNWGEKFDGIPNRIVKED